MRITQSRKRKPLAEGPSNIGVGRFKEQEPTVSASITSYNAKGDLIHTTAQFTVTEVRALAEFAEGCEIVKDWDCEVDPSKALDRWREKHGRTND